MCRKPRLRKDLIDSILLQTIQETHPILMWAALSNVKALTPSISTDTDSCIGPLRHTNLHFSWCFLLEAAPDCLCNLLGLRGGTNVQYLDLNRGNEAADRCGLTDYVVESRVKSPSIFRCACQLDQEVFHPGLYNSSNLDP